MHWARLFCASLSRICTLLSILNPECRHESRSRAKFSFKKYREYRKKGWIDNMDENQDVNKRMLSLINEAKIVVNAIKSSIKYTYTPQGFFDIFKIGFLPVPRLMYCREEFPKAVKWNTKLRNRGIDIYLDNNKI